MRYKSSNLDDLEGQYCNRNCISCSASFIATAGLLLCPLGNFTPLFIGDSAAEWLLLQSVRRRHASRLQITRRARRQRPEVGPACRRHLVEDCVATPFPQAAETLGRRPRWSTLLLQDSCTTGARVCVSGVAFKSHDRTVEGPGGDTAKGDDDNICAQRLWDVTGDDWSAGDTLETRRAQLTERFFRRSVLREASCLYYLLPDKRDSSVTDRLRRAKTFEPLPARTNKLRNSSILYCLEHFD